MAWRASTIALLVSAWIIAFAQTDTPSRARKPNFSGTWKLNLQRSGPIMPRRLEALTIVINHRDPEITSRETRVVSGKITRTADERSMIDGIEHVRHSEPGITVKQHQTWSGAILLRHWEKKVNDTRYVSDIKQTLSADGKVLIMTEHYREPGMERIRDWVFEKQ